MSKLVAIVPTGGGTDKEFQGLWCPSPVPVYTALIHLPAARMALGSCRCIYDDRLVGSADSPVGLAIAEMATEFYSAGIDSAIRRQLHSHHRVQVMMGDKIELRLTLHPVIRAVFEGRHPACWRSSLVELFVTAFLKGAKMADIHEVSVLGADLSNRCVNAHPRQLC